VPSLVPMSGKAVPTAVATTLMPTIAAKVISHATNGAHAHSLPKRRLFVPHEYDGALGRPQREVGSNPMSNQPVAAQVGTGGPATVNGCSLRVCP
jgi:hypothetical protein